MNRLLLVAVSLAALFLIHSAPAQAGEALSAETREALRRIPTDGKAFSKASKELTPHYREVAAPIFTAAFGRPFTASGFASRGQKKDGAGIHWSFGDYKVYGDWVQTKEISRRKALVVSINILYQAGAATKQERWNNLARPYRGTTITPFRFHGDRAIKSVRAEGKVQEISWQWGDHFITVSMADPKRAPDVEAMAKKVHAAAMASGFYRFPNSLFGEPKQPEREEREPASRYAEALEKQSARTRAVAAELMEMIRQSETDPAVIDRVGRRYLKEFERTIDVVDMYRRATKRFGLQSEIDAFIELLRAIELGQKALWQLVGEQPPVARPEREVEEAQGYLKTEILPMVKQYVDMRLGAQGAADLLTDFGFKQLVSTVANNVVLELEAELADQIKSIVGARLYVGMSLKDHLLAGARTWLSKKVKNIFLRLAAGHLAVDILGTRILEWIGPRLRERLRPKGNLDSRVEKARSGMRARRIRLDGMDSRSDLRHVRRTVEAALGHLRANKHLHGDLDRANETKLGEKLVAEERELVRAIERAKKRFHMDSPLAREEFGGAVRTLKAARDKTAQVLDAFAEKNR